MLGLANKELGGHEVPCSQLVMWKHTMGSKVHDALFPKYNMADGSQVREPQQPLLSRCRDPPADSTHPDPSARGTCRCSCTKRGKC